MEGEKINYLYLWLAIGIPFGIRQMCLWVIPWNRDLGSTIGILVMNFIVAGLIGGLVAIFQLLQAVWYLLKAVIQIFVKPKRSINE